MAPSKNQITYDIQWHNVQKFKETAFINLVEAHIYKK